MHSLAAPPARSHVARGRRRRCQEAVDAFGRLPAHHYQTGWVLCCVGRALFEMVDYPEAAKAFSWMRQVGVAGHVMQGWRAAGPAVASKA